MTINSISKLAFATFFAATILTACDTVAEKEAAAQEDVQDAKQDLKDVQQEANEAAEQKATAEEWVAYKAEIDAKIKLNEARIDDLKIKIKKPGTVLDPLYANKIEALEKRNRDLKARLVDYEAKQSDWGKFKAEFNRDMDELGKALSDFSVENK